MASAYAVDSYLQPGPVRDPWAQQCFLNVVDGFVNHESLVLPQATHFSVEHTGSTVLPQIVSALLQRGAVLLPSQRVAEDIVPDGDSLSAAFREFRLFALSKRDLLLTWLAFHEHSEIREHHAIHVPTRVQSFVSEYWASSAGPKNLEEQTGVPSNDLIYAFDVFFRGQQYDELLSSSKAVYFNHPLRSSLFSERARFSINERNQYSWGRVLSELIAAKRLSSRIDEVADLITSIRTEVRYHDASYDKLRNVIDRNPQEAIERLTAVAANVGLPAEITKSGEKTAQTAAGALGAVADSLLGTGPWATVVLASAAAVVCREGRYIPGKLGKLKLLRGAIAWPGLISRK